MAENINVAEKKENVFKKIAKSETVKKVVQIGTTCLTLLNTAFLIYTCISASSEAPFEVSNEQTKSEVTADPIQEVVNS